MYQQQYQQQQQQQHHHQQQQQQQQQQQDYYNRPAPHAQVIYQHSSTPDPLQFYQTTYDNPPTFHTSNNHPQHQSFGGNHGYSSFGPPSLPPQQQAGAMLPRGWLAALGTGGYPDEPPLLEELGIHFGHIKDKTFAVLNPIQKTSPHILDDCDLAGPLLFCVMFAFLLLLSGKVHFGYIYGLAVLGCGSMYGVLNLMSEQGLDIWRTASVLGYSLLPLVGLSGVSAFYPLKDIMGGFTLAVVAVGWCTLAASGMFVSALRMDEQRALVAYPVALIYATFAIITVF